MVATLNIVEQNKLGLDSQQTMIDLQAGADQDQAWRGLDMLSVHLPNQYSNVPRTPSCDISVVFCFSLANASRNSRMLPVDMTLKEVMPLTTKITKPLNQIQKSLTKYSTI